MRSHINRREDSRSPSFENLPPEVQAQIKTMMKNRWENWYNQPIPALNNMTPVEASKNNLGRDLLRSLLLEYEQNSEGREDFFLPDVADMRKRLNI